MADSSSDPLRLSQYLLSTCISRGVHLHQPARATSFQKDSQNHLSSITIHNTQSSTDQIIPCTTILFATGAWTPRAFRDLFPSSRLKIPISHLAGSSLVLKSPRWTTTHEPGGCHAIFTTDAGGFSPEVFSRLGGEIYIAGLNSSSLPLPEVATDAKVRESDVEKLQTVGKRLLGLESGEDDLEVLRSGLCFRPVTDRGTPILARIEDRRLGGLKTEGGGKGGVFVAAGHGPW